MTQIAIGPYGQITIPLDLLEHVGVHAGDELDLEITPEGLLLRPAGRDASQQWFWADAWQAGEREATRQIADGALQTFSTGEEFLIALRSVTTEPPPS